MVTQVDETTGEVLGDPFEGMSDDDLLFQVATLKTLASTYMDLSRQAEFAMIQRLKERKASECVTDRFGAKLVSRISYQYDMAKLAKLKEMLKPEEYARVVVVEEIPATTSTSVKKAELNKLERRGVEFQAIIKAATIWLEGVPSLRVERLAE